ncbi:unnamed protein product [Nippostrongylus brasiliensis]|uniref:MFS transporter n=1 Tax=Nippostrongylus brasiliensis TaxID=27835 RepID=A0A0N4YD06_NIPBR|nr:unnamed protein product [Nippostrongylus brasiliensis]
MNLNMFIAGFAQILLPGGVQLFQWSVLFYALAVLIITTTTLFVVFVRAKPARWTETKVEKTPFEQNFIPFPRLSTKVY